MLHTPSNVHRARVSTQKYRRFATSPREEIGFSFAFHSKWNGATAGVHLATVPRRSAPDVYNRAPGSASRVCFRRKIQDKHDPMRPRKADDGDDVGAGQRTRDQDVRVLAAPLSSWHFRERVRRHDEHQRAHERRRRQ